jgi:hypothetical protein
MKLALFYNLKFTKVYINLENNVIYYQNFMTNLFIWIYSGGGAQAIKVWEHVEYELDDRAIDSRQRQGIFFSSLYVQTGSGAHLASCPMGTMGVLSPGVKRGRDVRLTTHPM